jgi:GMP reductase
MRIEDDVKLDFDDVLIRPKRSTLKSRKEVLLDRTYRFRNSKRMWEGIPIIAANMDTVGTFEMASALMRHNMMTCIHKFYTSEQWLAFTSSFATDQQRMPCSVIPSFGASEAELQKIEVFEKAQFICLDVANGYGEYFVDAVKKVRKWFPDITIIAGNVVTGEMTEQLILSGADIVKVGIGPGSACTTRLKTGVGYPQLSAIIECADAAHGLGAHIIADGGCRTPGDIAKAFGGGADFVMLGGMLAGHRESGGEMEVIDGEQYKTFYGMSSDTAQQKYYGEQKAYRASEGRTVRVPYRGPVENTIQEILGGLRSTCTYVGAPALKQLSKCTTFIRVNSTHNTIFESGVTN